MSKKLIFLLYLIVFCTFILLRNQKCSKTEKPKNQNISEIEFEYTFNYDPLLNQHNLNKAAFFGVPYVSSVFHTRHIFRSISDYIFAIGMNNLVVENIKCGDILFIKTDNIKIFFEIYHPRIPNPYILITHESDYSIGDQLQLDMLNDSKIISWFGQNVIAKHSKLKPVPIGIVPPENEKFSTIYNLARNPIPYFKRSLLLYTNVAPHTNENRTKILEFFKHRFKSNYNVFIDETRITWTKYLQNLGNSQFILSPPGNGIDCHRTWEALIMGSVPIVLKSELQPLYEDMPVMVVKDWEEVTEQNLKAFQKQKLRKFSSDGIPLRPNIWLRYWIQKINGLKEEYVKNQCFV